MLAPMMIGIPILTLTAPSPTIATTMDVLVDEDGTNNVARMPAIRPEMGLSTALNKELAPLPPKP